MITRIKKWALLLISVAVFIPIASQADVVVIGNKSIRIDSITTKQAKKLWLGKLKKLGGIKITVVDQTPSNPAFEIFYTSIVKKTPSQLKTYWAKVSFTGKAFPPKQLKDDAAIIKWVASNPGALGYVDSTAVNDTVKPLLTAK
ncbi:hypothetical protein MNBD_GAMMA23-2140 [hydrothermal vent metagenome]|uniref:Phosphate ABC transporter substrate-binding protein n=1 Tax=hydrothermal vent metagenome TaxID=652676 RepID=A0A3B1AXY5_9ZZZZ